VHGASALGTAALHRRAVAAARAQFAAAVQLEQSAIAQAVAASADPHVAPQPSPSPICALSRNGACELLTQSAIALTTPGPSAAPSACPSTDCVIYLQANDTVAENRVTVSIASIVTAPEGSVLASRSGNVAFRTFNVPPYATLAGSLDATLDDIAANKTGDDGGASTGSTTLVNVEYRNALDPAATPIPANVWQPQTQHPATTASAWDY